MLPSRDDPYDPDMTVGEALDKGLIAVIESGRIGRTYNEMCGAAHARRAVYEEGVICTRAMGHDGPHAHVHRWNATFHEVERREQELIEAERLKRQSEEAALREMQLKARKLAEAERKVRKEASKRKNEEDRRLDREFSMTYGPQQPKNQRFRDKNVGKLKGRHP